MLGREGNLGIGEWREIETEAEIERRGEHVWSVFGAAGSGEKTHFQRSRREWSTANNLLPFDLVLRECAL